MIIQIEFFLLKIFISQVVLKKQCKDITLFLMLYAFFINFNIKNEKIVNFNRK
jgi:hypothetical protein